MGGREPMTLPASIRVNTAAPFPSLVTSTAPVTIRKVNGIWTIGFSSASLAVMSPPAGNYPTDYVLVYDSIAGTFFNVSISQIIAAAAAAITTVAPPPTIVTAAGNYTVLAGDVIILMNKTVGAATNINLPTSASRLNVPVTVKDYKGDSSSNNIVFVANGTETIDGFSSAAALANGTSVIRTNYGVKTLNPLPSGGWYTS